MEGASLRPLSSSSEFGNLGGSTLSRGESLSVTLDASLTPVFPTVPDSSSDVPVECEDVGPDWGVEHLKVEGPGVPLSRREPVVRQPKVRRKVDGRG